MNGPASLVKRYGSIGSVGSAIVAGPSSLGVDGAGKTDDDWNTLGSERAGCAVVLLAVPSEPCVGALAALVPALASPPPEFLDPRGPGLCAKTDTARARARAIETIDDFMSDPPILLGSQASEAGRAPGPDGLGVPQPRVLIL